MTSLKTIKKRISSVKNTQQITKAMKMVSAAKLRKAQQAVLDTRPYANKMSSVIANLVNKVEVAHPLLKKRPRERALILLVTGDRGLCGGFNVNISKAVERFCRTNPEEDRRPDEIPADPAAGSGDSLRRAVPAADSRCTRKNALAVSDLRRGHHHGCRHGLYSRLNS